MNGPSVAYVTAGGAGMYCGSCMRDNSLVAALRASGVDVVLIPTFTPIRTDEEDVSIDRIFVGGINVYLEHRWPIFRRLPAPLRRTLDSRRLLSLLSRLTLQTRSEQDGRIAVSLLRGRYGHQRAELDDLVDWLAVDLKPDLVNLTNLLISGFVPALRRRHDVPVLVTLQGDDIFLDGLNPDDRAAVLAELRKAASRVDGFVTFSRDYRDRMAELLEQPTERFSLVPLGLTDPQAYAPPPLARTDRPQTLGYLARICPEKGFHRLVDAFIRLRLMPGTEQARLRVAGWLGASDRRFFDEQCRRLRDAGLAEAFETVAVDDRESKVRFLHGLDLMSVPTSYREPKGLYVLEALAAGVPVVLPAHGSFPELLERTGGGRLVQPDDPDGLAHTLHELLLDPNERHRLAAEGMQGVRTHADARTMAGATLAVWEQALERGGVARARCETRV